VAALALAGYVAALAASLAALPAGRAAAAQPAALALLALAPVFTGVAVWFAGLQLLAVRRVCGYCLAIHAVGVAVAVLAVTAARGRGMEWAAISAWTTPGWIGLAAFIAGHVLLRPRMHEVRAAAREARNPKLEIRKKLKARNPNDGNGGVGLQTPAAGVGGKPPPQPSPGVSREGEIAARAGTHERHGPRGPAGAGSRRVRAFGGRVDLAIGEWPVLGMPGAADVAVFVFDYTCRECRHMRRLILQALARHPGRLAVLLVPVPIDPACNPEITQPNAARPDACGYVRLAWALWRADPLAHARFDEWLSAPPCAPPLRDAVAAASRFAPGADLDTSSGSELKAFIDGRIAQAVAVYRALDGKPVPALLFPGTALRGHVESVAALLAILEREMKLKPAARRAAARV
jgi:hypothetical protein